MNKARLLLDVVYHAGAVVNSFILLHIIGSSSLHGFLWNARFNTYGEGIIEISLLAIWCCAAIMKGFLYLAETEWVTKQ